MEPGEIVALSLSAVAVVARGFFAGAETAIASVGHDEAEELLEEGRPGARQLLRAKEHVDATQSALRAALMGLHALAAALATYAGVSLGARLVDWERAGLTGWSGALIAAAVSAGVVTAVTFFFGDMVPRSFAAGKVTSVARRRAWAVNLLRRIVAPMVRADLWLARRLLSPFGIDASKARPPPPLEDIERYLADHAARGSVHEGAPDLVHSIFEFGETTAKEVMVPRTQVVALEIGATAGDILDVVSGHGHTRVPVYRDEIDNIVGIINAKDIIPLIQRGESFDLLKILRPTTFVPWSKPIDELMQELQARHIHMAMVVDEFGGFMGLVTLEDILEEIVGEIEDEFDRPEQREVEALPDGSFLVRGAMDVEAFNQAFSVEIPEDEDYETLAGFLNTLAGAIPKIGDTFFHEGLQFTVIKSNDRRVRQIRVRRVRQVTREI